jgi:hypothetical protein
MVARSDDERTDEVRMAFVGWNAVLDFAKQFLCAEIFVRGDCR